MITKGEHPEWEKQNFGLGMKIRGVGVDSDDSDDKSFGHSGGNSGYSMDFRCTPKKKHIEIVMVNHNQKFFKEDPDEEAIKLLK